MTDIGGNSKEQLKSIVDRIEVMEAEIKEKQEGRAEIYAEAKSGGFDVKALRTIVRMRRMDASTRSEQEAILDSYLTALGML